MGKYTALKGKLKKGFRKEESDDSFISRVNEAKGPLRKLEMKDLLAQYRRHRLEKEAAEEVLTGVNAKVRAAEELIVEAQDQQGITSMKDKHGTYYQEYVPQVDVKDEDAAKQWASDAGHDYLWCLQPGRLAALIKTMAVEGEQIPEFFELSGYTRLKMKKGEVQDGEAGQGNSGAPEEEPF